MAPNISLREYIRWPPAPASEPTTTVVLTSAEARFVDIRIFLPTSTREGRSFRSTTTDSITSGAAKVDKKEEEDVLPFVRLDWAFAGTSSSQPLPIDPHSVTNLPPGLWNGAEQVGEVYRPFVHSKWIHWVDSRTLEPESVVDEGYMYPAHDGSTLERGRMVNPATGEMAEYEEKWIDVEPMATFASKSWTAKRRYDNSHDYDTEEGTRELVVFVLQEETHKARGMVIRIGHYCQGFLRVGEHMSLERWVWDEWDGAESGKVKKSWRRQVRIGNLWLPCGPAMEMEGPSGKRLELGGTVTYGEYEWKLVELARF